jgi:hypothetical protein
MERALVKQFETEAVLITGEMRSGTTFLANFLNSQEDTVVYADMLVSLFMEAHHLGISDIQVALTEREKNVLLSNLIQEGKLHQLDFSGIDRRKELSWFDLFKKALDVIKGDRKVKIVGVKRTREEAYLLPLLESGVKVVYCVRDPRDVVISAKNRFARFNLFKAAENWQQSVRLALQLKDQKYFFVLRYEDLILEKDKTAHQLSDFLELPVTTNLSEFKFGHDKLYRDNSSFGDVNKLFDPSATYRWKSNSANPEVQFVEKLLEPEMQDMGYEPSGDSPGDHTLWKKYKKQKLKQKMLNPIKRAYQRWIR